MFQSITPRGWDIAGFCAAYQISKSMYYKLEVAGLSPDTIYIGAKRFITVKAADRWEQRISELSPQDWKRLLKQSVSSGAA